MEMKNLLAIKIQSHTDLITNSSSELFQLKTDSTVEQVKEALREITTGYIDPVFFNLKEYRKLSGKFNEMLNKTFPLPTYTKETEQEWDEAFQRRCEYKEKLIEEHPEYYIYDIVKGWFFDKNIPEHVCHAYKNYLCGDHPYMWEGDVQLDSVQTEFHKFVLGNGYEEDARLSIYRVPDNLVAKFIETHEVPNIEDIWEWSGYYSRVEDLEGCVIVLSKDDNSIPYDTWDTINEMFNGTNYHLG